MSIETIALRRPALTLVLAGALMTGAAVRADVAAPGALPDLPTAEASVAGAPGAEPQRGFAFGKFKSKKKLKTFKYLWGY